ncbi:hypothetical protein KUTeg_008901 [Tegillarca granosa]|uniref:Uncharacterized protein n=1 Tax=Tegillarca granosa TaxID=220873 RepID=A0ABQ9FF92_TEGGR|nr:hypothetical protein KUTeg_008901 [Tegillarca granosa]
MTDQRVALITGGNAGIGLTVAERLLSLYKDLQLCLACRNRVRAENACHALQLSHPEANISIIIMDTSSYPKLILIISAKESFLSENCVYMLTTGHGLLQQTDEDTPEGLKQIFATNLFGHFVLIQELKDTLLLGGSKSTQIVWTSSRAAAPNLFNIDDIQHSQSIDPYGVSKHTTDILSVALNDKLNSKGIYSHTTCPGLVMTNLTYGIMPYWCWILLLPFFFLVRNILMIQIFNEVVEIKFGIVENPCIGKIIAFTKHLLSEKTIQNVVKMFCIHISGMMRLFVGSLNYSSYNGSEALVIFETKCLEKIKFYPWILCFDYFRNYSPLIIFFLLCGFLSGGELLLHKVWLPSQRPETLDPRAKYCSQTNILGQCYIKKVKKELFILLANLV